MARGDPIRTQRHGSVEQQAEFHVPVADDAGIRRPAREVLLAEVVLHRLELAANRQDMVGNTKMAAEHPRPVNLPSDGSRLIPVSYTHLTLPTIYPV